mmetsp:Transcript_14366/g.41896  ORF Transcript_14366/g.41896 Transcript_14366/m.41896 type:complete len:276 (+) Transcript_14366:467-1294(+)
MPRPEHALQHTSADGCRHACSTVRRRTLHAEHAQPSLRVLGRRLHHAGEHGRVGCQVLDGKYKRAVKHKFERRLLHGHGTRHHYGRCCRGDRALLVHVHHRLVEHLRDEQRRLGDAAEVGAAGKSVRHAERLQHMLQLGARLGAELWQLHDGLVGAVGLRNQRHMREGRYAWGKVWAVTYGRASCRLSACTDGRLCVATTRRGSRLRVPTCGCYNRVWVATGRRTHARPLLRPPPTAAAHARPLLRSPPTAAAGRALQTRRCKHGAENTELQTRR